MNDKIIFEEFPGSYEQRCKKQSNKRVILIVSLISLVIFLSILSTLLNLKMLNK